MFFLKLWSLTSVEGFALMLQNFLRLYHESLAALLQGYREVTMDHSGKFRFEDGQTVQDRLDKFERKLHKATTGQDK
jgi:hypothetical protein